MNYRRLPFNLEAAGLYSDPSKSVSIFANGVIRLGLLNLYILRDADAFVKGLQQQHDSTSSPCSVELGKIRIPP